jgi:DNA-binding transcriptional LysR family regulator
VGDSIAHYESFLAVAEAGSISEAAKRLFVTQPAVSAEIASLEHTLGMRLFFRTNRGVRLTPEGTVLYGYIKKAFSFISAGEEKLRELGGLKSGLLRIGASDMTLRFFLLDYITEFRELYPDVHLTVTNNPTPKTFEALRNGSIDFGVVSEPFSIASEEDFVLVPVREINDIFIVKSDDPLADKKGITKKELAAHPVIMLERHTSTRSYVSSYLGSDFPPPVIELATSDLLLEFAKRGIGISSIVEDFAKEELEKGSVRRLDLLEPIPPRRFFLVFLRRIPLSTAAERMISLIEEKNKYKESI